MLPFTIITCRNNIPPFIPLIRCNIREIIGFQENILKKPIFVIEFIKEFSDLAVAVIQVPDNLCDILEIRCVLSS